MTKQTEIRNTAEAMLAFIAECPTAFHTVAQTAARLQAAGYTELNEGDRWQLTPGGRYFTTRNHSSLIAFRVRENLHGFSIVAAHSDSPTFKIKDRAEMKNSLYVRLNVEKYGGMICSSWLDRPLSVAGRLVVRTASGVQTRLCAIDRDFLIIPSLAIHMNRNVNEGVPLKANVDMVPLYGSATAENSFRALLAENAGVKEEDILATDLYLWNRQPGQFLGANDEFLISPRLDDLACVFGAMAGFIAANDSAAGEGIADNDESATPILAILDNEEVGSGTKQGADSTFLSDVLHRIAADTETPKSESDYIRAVANSFMVSADNAHAIHPNHPECSDPTNGVVMNGGIVLKFNAAQKYTTDAISAAVFTEICRGANVPVQHYTNRADMAGGSTLGNIAGSHVSLNTVDIGLAQLAMHSSVETAGATDPFYLVKALTRFYTTSFTATADGLFIR